MYGLTLVTAPTEEPVTLGEVKAWLRQDEGADDAVITGMIIPTARDLAERLLGRQLCTATWRLTLDGFPRAGGWAFLDSAWLLPDPHTIRLPKAPLRSVTHVKYYDLDNTLQTLAASVYDVDAASDPGRVTLGMNQVWPVTRLRPGAVQVTFEAGYGAAQAVPPVVRTAVAMASAFLYEHRGEGPAERLPAHCEQLLLSNWNGEREYGL